jgi:hypothetical protein
MRRSSIAIFIVAFSALLNGTVFGGWTVFPLVRDDSPRVRWRGERIAVAISASLNSSSPNIKYGSDVAGAIERSLNAWRPFVDLQLKTDSSKLQDVSASGTPDGTNLITIAPSAQNVLYFAKDPTSPAKTRGGRVAISAETAATASRSGQAGCCLMGRLRH